MQIKQEMQKESTWLSKLEPQSAYSFPDFIHPQTDFSKDGHLSVQHLGVALDAGVKRLLLPA